MLQKQNLILLSDLWGNQQNAWIPDYLSTLSLHFHIQNLDSCQLAQLPLSAISQEERHQHFINGGIDLAVQQLATTIKAPTAILAFSIGGTIAWKAGLQGLPITKLYAASATRLRYETQKPPFPTQLAYGSLDPYRPKPQWLETMGLKVKTFVNAEHDFYSQKAHIPEILQDIQKFNLDR